MTISAKIKAVCEKPAEFRDFLAATAMGKEWEPLICFADSKASHCRVDQGGSAGGRLKKGVDSIKKWFWVSVQHK